MPAPPVPEDQVDITFLLKKAEYARKVGSPRPEANEVIPTPTSASHVVSAKATATKPPMAAMHDTDTRTL